MKIHAFKVEASSKSFPLEKILGHIQSEKRLDSRLRKVHSTELRVDAIDKKDGLWYLDFVQIRAKNGPGKVSRDSEAEGFKFKPGEAFGEETGALYDPETEYMIIQYNHFGVRSGLINYYLNIYNNSEDSGEPLPYNLKPKYDFDIERRLYNQKIIRKVEFTIDVSKMTPQESAD